MYYRLCKRHQKDTPSSKKKNSTILSVLQSFNSIITRDYLEYELAIPQEKVSQVANVGVAHVNAFLAELRRLFLVEDLVDSIKFGVLLWGLTYLGSWFNGMTLVILGEFTEIINKLREVKINLFSLLFRIRRFVHLTQGLRKQQAIDRHILRSSPKQNSRNHRQVSLIYKWNNYSGSTCNVGVSFEELSSDSDIFHWIFSSWLAHFLI